MTVRRDAIGVAVVALAARLAVVAWAAERFPPVEDGHYYHVVATRIARGLGYTWLWPDGAVTYAAHYPIGYPGILGGLYAIFGDAPVVAMLFNAALGAFAAVAAYFIAATVGSRRAARFAGLAVGLHPALVFYTPALMTEAVVGAVLALAGWVVVWIRNSSPDRRFARVLLLGFSMGVATLLRPQNVLLCPVFGALALAGYGRRGALLGAAMATAVALLVCVPWTFRNCVRMERCVFVSANSGWNLFIGSAPEGEGTFVPIERVGVPDACREVFSEAEKDACFRDAAVDRIARAPAAWLALLPSKLAATFDYGGAPGWYLHASGPAHFDRRAKVALGVVETVFHRVGLLFALVSLARVPGPRVGPRRIVCATSALFVFMKAAWVAHIGMLISGVLLGRRLFGYMPAALCLSVVALTAIVHTVFFGAGRYSLVCAPLLFSLAATALTRVDEAGDTVPSETRRR